MATKFEEFLDVTFQTMRDNLTDFPSTPCPGDNKIRSYVSDMSKKNTVVTPEDRAHFYSCKKCYNLMTEWLCQSHEEAIARETAIVADNLDNSDILIGVLQDVTQPVYVREYAAESIADQNCVSAKEILHTIATTSDEDEFLRETCDECLNRIK